ncbi:hypothetical protein N7462_008866 [Penicillium macrosclerotiorum]|uniref:uncharacterized protein n=1 Tax=Penicillium macrosclerotiorum TaxID=303699 RepID=UPI002549BFDA|nr:uncharacterized protein N7462_008866 [Penicillium macrosclerotiorum]KAJ5675969.1 hypothetical protein N7462_008866 [Penicillium macrosclerotiorum]
MASHSQSSPRLRCSVDPVATDNTSSMKRRKIRKGTRSCWECRQRKMKCIFNQPTDTICIRCRRRGVNCVSQEYPEEITSSLDRSLQMGDRMEKVERLIEQLLNRDSANQYVSRTSEANEHNQALYDETLASKSANFNSSLTEALFKPSTKPETSEFEIIDSNCEVSKAENVRTSFISSKKYEKLSRVLHAVLPPGEDISSIVKACGNTSSLFYQMQIVPYNDLDTTRSLESIFERPGANFHPVLIAKYMLNTATALQHLHPDFDKDMAGLSEPPREMMRRLAGVAINVVTTNDDLVNCIEGLECMLLESWYHTNGGNLRKGLVTIRRAMTIAQLMGFHRPGRAQCKSVHRQTKAYPEFIWFRINSLERYLCLMLGLPQTTLDHSMASEAALSRDTAMGRLERIHCVITSRLLERNQSNPDLQNFHLTQELDGELQKASRFLTDKWWLAPNLATVASQPAALFWDMRRLFHHLFHYNLLIQLHLPYMLHASASGQKYDYSEITCVNSAREILSRFVMFHSFNRIAFSCRTVDFFGLMAAMTLLIAHVQGHQGCRQNPAMVTANALAHQRPSDRGLIENVQEIMLEVSRLGLDTMSVQISSILQRLMAIEAAAADLSVRHAESARDTIAGEDLYSASINDTVGLSIPYFGVIGITQNGIIFENAPENRPAAVDSANPCEPPTQVESANYRDIGTLGVSESDMLKYGNLRQYDQNSQLASGENDGIIQDTDIAFFDALMRGIGNDEDDSIDWLAWLNDFSGSK